jgi:glycosyltransferase involved in cell wall biosynthesis
MVKKLTIIVPTRNEASNIETFLESLPSQIPLIIVDDSTDETPELIKRYGRANTTLLHESSTITEARQIGAEAAKTEWLLFTDADVIFSPDYFQNWQKYAAVAAAYGPKLSQDDYSAYYRWFSRGMQLSHQLGIPAASGSNLLIRQSVLLAVGGFDLQLTCNEDSEIVWRIKRYGRTVRFAPDLIVYARDHRRLQRGVIRKTAHSLLRCGLLFTGLLPQQWRGHDWGYWSPETDRSMQLSGE